MAEWKLYKYPRTAHLEGSRLGFGDGTDTVAVRALAGQHLIIEEKVDGANTAVSFSADGRLRLQSRGHELAGGSRETQFALLKTWAAANTGVLRDVLGDRYIAYGEWCFAKHSMFYDILPHYWFEFDVLDTTTGQFLDTPTRHAMWAGTGVVSVPVLGTGSFSKIAQITAHIGPTLYQSQTWRDSLNQAAVTAGCSPEEVAAHTDMSGLAEGVYVKSEADGHVVGRYKWVRSGFNQVISDSGTHWADRPIVANRLVDPGVLWQ